MTEKKQTIREDGMILQWDDEDEIWRPVTCSCGRPLYKGEGIQCHNCRVQQQRQAGKAKPMSDGDIFSRSF
jgi:hypothetical protein